MAPGGNQRVQAPFQSGYFASLAAWTALTMSPVAINATAIALVEHRNIMIVLPRRQVA
jgi:hypothetical protein